MRINFTRIAGVMALLPGLTILAGAQASQVRTFAVKGAKLEYVDAGRGTAVVFAHGAVTDLRLWDPQRQAISQDHRFIAYTYRYHGVGPWPDDGKSYSATTHAADLVALIEGLKIGPVHLVGLSYGGHIAARVARDRPQLVRTLTLAEPGLFELLDATPEGKRALEAWNKGAEPMVAALKNGDTAGATRHLAQLVLNQGPGSFDKLPAAFRQMLTDNARTLPLLFASADPAVTCEMLGTIKAPTLVVGGANTPSVFSATNDAVVKCIAGSRLKVIPKAGHAMSYDNPAEFNKVVLSFVGGH
jgi:pimeloyl-ACP methyl ester carboxylesterase